MKFGPKYKIARRYGADLFEKTQTAKYALRTGRGVRPRKKGAPRSRSEFASQLREKQRARLLYGISERQFARYVRTALEKRGMSDDEALYRALEGRLDNVVYRLGIAPTRQAARQFVSHGHFTVNGVRVTIPSYGVAVGDVIAVRAGSAKKAPFAAVEDAVRDRPQPVWLRFDTVKGIATVVGAPRMVKAELPFTIAAILEFYRR
ncbi:MAG: small subunit ribosomal protein S4 [Parcubacteria group bacterium Greene0416_79]|nr:MAG: small subunit ribosomal protein S4 [Parcubacteria group bacterium Greene0416_79]